ncbi:hypothetical protein AB0V79_25260 [Mesorhizobium ciceri]|uniref:hypothetical protein n=1 Tax=Mesorhizobium TaxID=68287 RepID=UPI000A9BB02D|nr:hypothetical protein [Mesorhizobium ciceri]
MQLTGHLSLSAEVALLFTRLDGEDQHHMRSFIGQIPEDGDGHGVQIEAVLKYEVADLFNIGVGSRYWGVAANGTAHFEKVGFSPQVEKWEVERYGVFVQASIKFN